MSKLGAFLFLIILHCTPHTCQTQRISGAPLIMATKNLLAMTEAIVHSANVDAERVQTKIKEIGTQLRHNATAIRGRIETVLNDTFEIFEERINGLVASSNDVAVNYCGISSSSAKSTAAKILMDVNLCVSNTVESIETVLNDSYSSIKSILARINSDQNLAETCLAEFDKTEMALRNAIVTALCVSQAKERILLAIKDDISTRNDAAVLDVLHNDALDRLTSCDDSKSVSTFVANMDSTYLQMMTCISSS